jgi:hypothetical protein
MLPALVLPAVGPGLMVAAAKVSRPCSVRTHDNSFRWGALILPQLAMGGPWRAVYVLVHAVGVHRKMSSLEELWNQFTCEELHFLCFMYNVPATSKVLKKHLVGNLLASETEVDPGRLREVSDSFTLPTHTPPRRLCQRAPGTALLCLLRYQPESTPLPHPPCPACVAMLMWYCRSVVHGPPG